MTTSLDLIRATKNSKASKWSVSLCFRAYFWTGSGSNLSLIVEAKQRASHFAIVELTSYELKVNESMKILVKKFLLQVWKLSEKISGCFQLWRVCYIRNVEIFEKVGFSLFNLNLNSVLDHFFELFCWYFEKFLLTEVWIKYEMN